MDDLELMFPEFFKSQIFFVCPDIVIVDKPNEEPMFNLMLGIKSLAKFGTGMDFQDKSIQIDHAKIAIRPYSTIGRKSNQSNDVFQADDMYVSPGTSTFVRDHLKAISIYEAPNCMIKIVYAESEKTNLPEIAKDTCWQVSSLEQSKPLWLSTKYEEVFDGTLGGFDADPVKLGVQMGSKAYHRMSYPMPQSQTEISKK